MYIYTHKITQICIKFDDFGHVQAPDPAVGPAGLGAALAQLPWPRALHTLEKVTTFGASEESMGISW